MDDEQPNLGALQAEMDEDRIDVSLQIMEQLLNILGEAWGRIDLLESQIDILKMGKQTTGQVPAAGMAKGSADGVIIIDDSKLMQLRLCSSIESLGFRVIGIADNGLTGAKLVEQRNPKLVILDHNMPVMNGSECLQTIRQRSTTVRVIVCTGKVTKRLTQDYLNNDVSAILAKPIQLDRFASAVKECMSYDQGKAKPELDHTK